MFSLKVHRTIQAIILCSLLTTPKPLNAAFTENIDLTPYQPYIITCVASCCMGAIIYALVCKYCSVQPTIIPKQNTKEKEARKQLFELLQKSMKTIQADIDLVKRNHDNVINLLTEQRNNATELNTKVNNVQTSIDLFAHQAKTIERNDQPTGLLPLLKFNNNCVLIASALYWYKMYNQQIKECEEYKIQLNSPETHLTIHNNEKK